MNVEKIISIEEIGELESIDIEVEGNHLFFANKILTHNSSTDVGLEDTSESFGLPATADFMFALISNEELEELGQILVKQLKNRYSDPSTYKRFVIGVDRAKMKLYDLEESAQKNIMNIVNDSKKVKKQDEYDDVPVFDNGTDNKFRKKDFSNFNF